LSNLIWFGFGAIALEVETLSDAGAGEDMVAALSAHPKPLGLKQMADFQEAEVGIRLAAQQFLDGLLDAHAGATMLI
jgi:hypothetical protein